MTIRLFLATIFLVSVAHCQLVVNDKIPQNWGGAGVAYNSASRPAIAGWTSYATMLLARGPLYSFTSMDITSSKAKPYTAQTSMRTGLATVVRSWGPVTILGFGDAGMATVPILDGTSIRAAFSGGGVGIVKLGRSNWDIAVCARVIRTSGNGSQTVYEVGIGRSF